MDEYADLYATCRKHIEAGQFQEAAGKLLSSPHQITARFLEELNSAEQYIQRMDESIQSLRLGRYDDALALLKEMKPCASVQNMLSLTENLIELFVYSIELSKGNLSVEYPSRKNYIAMGVKNLHSKINHLVWQIEQVARGDYDQRIDYMGELSEGYNWMTAQLKARKEQIEYEQSHDAQTGLLNRTAFMRQVYEEIQAQSAGCGIMLCGSLDNVKYINETYGHENGDRYIIAVADIFRSYEAGGAIVARMAGDEFAFYLHMHRKTDADVLIERAENDLFEKLSQSEVVLDEIVKIRASFGVALYPYDAATVDNLVKYASHTMFEVKNSNRGTLMRFSPEIYRKKTDVLERQEKLNDLLEKKSLRFVFQPIIRLKDISVFGYEALMRPTTPDFFSPLDILAVAEAQSKLPQLEKITYELIFKWVDEHASQLNGCKIFFNTISTRFMNALALKKLHPHYRDICRHIVFEVLESGADGTVLLKDIQMFRQELGVMVAIDDYGCGYSNDLRLMQLAPDIVKIDRFFITGIDKDFDRQQMLSKIITYCKAKGIAVLAEGIETEMEMETIFQLGCTYGQGYYLGKPVELSLGSTYQFAP
jgi:diguanylate cyclase (GGDEF)-like protein